MRVPKKLHNPVDCEPLKKLLKAAHQEHRRRVANVKENGLPGPEVLGVADQLKLVLDDLISGLHKLGHGDRDGALDDVAMGVAHLQLVEYRARWPKRPRHRTSVPSVN
jgi:hypothetical protein